MLLKILLETRELRGNPRILLFMMAGWAFFLPTLILSDVPATFWSYGIAHGAQYLVFMMVISRNQERGRLGLCQFGLMAIASLFLFRGMYSSPSVSAVFTGVVMAHFLIDAKVWRLREPLQREIVSERFRFIFP
jgi:hypothetical protein